MCPLFNAEVIINNAFYAKNRTNVLSFDELKTFVNKLYEKITSTYKYVALSLNENDIDEYCENSNKFAVGIDKIYLLKTVEDVELKEINSRYDEHIQKVLECVRSEFIRP